MEDRLEVVTGRGVLACDCEGKHEEGPVWGCIWSGS